MPIFDPILRMHHLTAAFAVDRRTIERWIEDEHFPRGYHLTARTIAWERKTIEEWLRERGFGDVAQRLSREYPDGDKEPSRWNPRPLEERFNKEYIRDIRREFILAYGSKCVCCDESDMRFLSVDHVNGQGHLIRKAKRGLREIQKLKDRGWPLQRHLQVLCYNCNFAKAQFGNVCPHELDRRILCGTTNGMSQSAVSRQLMPI